MSAESNSSLVYSCDGVGPSGSMTTVLVALSYGVLIPLIVAGNGLVVASFIINQKLRTATNIFICGLGLSDLLIGVFSVPYWTYTSTLNSFMGAFCTPLYNVYICIDIGTGCASILQLTSIAIERLYFTVAPLKHRRLPRSVYWYMLAIAWIFSIFAAGMQPLQNKAKWHDEYSVFVLVTCFVFPLIIIIAVYLYILKVSRDHAKSKSSTQTRMGSTGGHIKEFNMFVTVIVITGVFVVAWAPFFVTTVIANFCPTCLSRPESDHLVRFVKWMQYSSSAINPYIYAYRNKDVQASFKRIVCTCLCSCCQKDSRFKSGTPSQSRRQKYDNSCYSNSQEKNMDLVRNGTVPRLQFQESLDLKEIMYNDPPQSRKHTQGESSRDPKVTELELPKCKGPYYENKGFIQPQLMPQLKINKKEHNSKQDKNCQREIKQRKESFNSGSDLDNGRKHKNRSRRHAQLEQRERGQNTEHRENSFDNRRQTNNDGNRQIKRPRSHSLVEQRKKETAQRKRSLDTEKEFNNNRNERKPHLNQLHNHSQIEKADTGPLRPQSYQHISIGKAKSFIDQVNSYDNPVDTATTYV